MKTTKAILVLVAVSAMSTTVQANVLYSENFDGATDGAPLTAISGWINAYGNVPDVTSAAPLGGGSDLAIDQSTAVSGQTFSRHPNVAPSADALSYTLEADLYSSEPGSFNSGIGFGVGTTEQVTVAWLDGWFFRVTAGWAGAAGNAATFTTSTEGVDEEVRARIHFDLEADTVQASIIGASGTFTSPLVSFADGNESNLGDLMLFADMRGASGQIPVDVDNILLSEAIIPEPTTAMLTLGGLMALIGRRKK
jgi:hypothetical protein